VGNTPLKTKAYLTAQRELKRYIEKNAGTTKWSAEEVKRLFEKLEATGKEDWERDPGLVELNRKLFNAPKNTLRPKKVVN
jgi:hypothetical protein